MASLPRKAVLLPCREERKRSVNPWPLCWSIFLCSTRILLEIETTTVRHEKMVYVLPRQVGLRQKKTCTLFSIATLEVGFESRQSEYCLFVDRGESLRSLSRFQSCTVTKLAREVKIQEIAVGEKQLGYGTRRTPTTGRYLRARERGGAQLNRSLLLNALQILVRSIQRHGA